TMKITRRQLLMATGLTGGLSLAGQRRPAAPQKLPGSPSHPTALLPPQLTAQLGHNGTVYSAVFSPDARFVLTASYDNTARLWETATGKEIRKFEGHSDAVHSAVFTPDARFVLTASLDSTARLWETMTGK